MPQNVKKCPKKFGGKIFKFGGKGGKCKKVKCPQKKHGKMGIKWGLGAKGAKKFYIFYIFFIRTNEPQKTPQKCG